jgi:recombination DNA repair RAD52 pathway protein
MVYVEGHTIINLANKLFGFNGWSSEIKRMETDYVGINLHLQWIDMILI